MTESVEDYSSGPAVGVPVLGGATAPLPAGATALAASGPQVATRTPRNKRAAARTRYVVKSVLLWAFAMLFLLPFVWMLSSSLKRNIDVFSIPPTWIPDPVQWQNYVVVWLEGIPSMAVFFANSITVSGLGLIGDLTTSALAGYAFARLSFKGRDKVFLLYLATTIVPTQLLLIPRFMFFQQVGFYNTLWALILPGIFTVFGTFLMRQAFLAVPAELGEAARMDGAGEFRLFFRIYLPQVRATLAALAIISWVGSWNDYETPLIMLSNEFLYTIPLGLTRFVDADGGLSAGLAMAGSVSSVIPVLVVFLVFQRQFVAALANTGIK
ncbi:binding-protein-dependent transport systems inner membrane component [Beutenbergia cavernae DSM 12333]|uniref:Binding-protein-dependent transport systems inner membrane component n=1 Tax=Beutenbergia cavernae (strain ATCC BAA-8 / DSM 12333 / CCUG 43141 / JCM 11478 / NBRC 16432 / NCIMB 13614 / HKI 0122) TaxID=471853 RepID=C5BYH7_BEUC1|nr:ABC transporter permease subunit [Beutenbergia cavernae]ACQ81077.1 binding-protein-dependent transport systems inner membrane component [Beutenbergia cavernae DSM 12333]